MPSYENEPEMNERRCEKEEMRRDWEWMNNAIRHAAWMAEELGINRSIAHHLISCDQTEPRMKPRIASSWVYTPHSSSWLVVCLIFSIRSLYEFCLFLTWCSSPSFYVPCKSNFRFRVSPLLEGASRQTHTKLARSASACFYLPFLEMEKEMRLSSFWIVSQ